MSAVEILSLRTIGKGQLVAVARVRVASCVEFDVRIFEPEDGDSYIGLPQAPIRANGTGWKAVLAITDYDVLAELNRKVLGAWNDFVPPRACR